MTAQQTFEFWHNRCKRKLNRSIQAKANDPTEKERLVALLNSLEAKSGEIQDWVRACVFDLASFSAESALQRTAEWHEAMANLGAGKFYEPVVPANVIHKFADGWSLQRVVSENDFKVEGNLMRHCVASYHDRGDCIILSMRDQINMPHATFEVDKDMVNVKQSVMKANQPLSPELDARFKSWFWSWCMEGKLDNGEPRMSLLIGPEDDMEKGQALVRFVQFFKDKLTVDRAKDVKAHAPTVKAYYEQKMKEDPLFVRKCCEAKKVLCDYDSQFFSLEKEDADFTVVIKGDREFVFFEPVAGHPKMSILFDVRT